MKTGWTSDPVRHGLAARGISNFAYRQNFIVHEPRKTDEFTDKTQVLVNLYNKKIYDLMLDPQRVEKQKGEIKLIMHQKTFENFDKDFKPNLAGKDIQPDFLLDAANPGVTFFLVTGGDMGMVRSNPDLQDALVINLLQGMEKWGPYEVTHRDWYYTDGLPFSTKLVVLPKMLKNLLSSNLYSDVYKNKTMHSLLEQAAAGHSEEEAQVILDIFKREAAKHRKKHVDESFKILDSYEHIVKDAKDLKIAYFYSNLSTLRGMSYYTIPTSDDKDRCRELLDRWGGKRAKLFYGPLAEDVYYNPEYSMTPTTEALLRDLAD